MSPRNPRSVILPVVIAVGAALVALIMALSSTGSDDGDLRTGDRDAARAPGDDIAWNRPAPTAADDPLAKGSVDAPVVMIVYSEFQCPYCGKFARDTGPALQRFVDDGTLRIEWKDFPYLGDESFTAAHAARAAGRQGKFWALHDRLYADQAPVNGGRLTADHLADLARDLGLDVDRFRADLTADDVKAQVRADLDQAIDAGITATPALVINGQLIMGAQPTETFVQAVEMAAAAPSHP